MTKKKVLAFDLDGTLAPSKSQLPDRIAELLGQLLDTFDICVISGGNFQQFQIQIINQLHIDEAKMARLHLMPTCGTRYYRFIDGEWKRLYAEDFNDDEKKEIITALTKGVDELGYHEKEIYGETIEDRGSQITFAALGQDIVAELGDEGVARKKAWDPDGSKKKKLRDYVAELLPNFEVRVGGETSVDITKPGIDKAYGMRKLMEAVGVSEEEILFFGDRLAEGGNDYPVKAMGIDSLEVSEWQDTVLRLEAIAHIVD